jgi:KUP system potassium uptake protein
MALANRKLGGKSALIVALGMVSAALFYGDAMITPALSVLSAVEGLEVIAPALGRFVVPLSVVILFALFMLHGTARRGSRAFSGRSRSSGLSHWPPPASIM